MSRRRNRVASESAPPVRNDEPTPVDDAPTPAELDEAGDVEPDSKLVEVPRPVRCPLCYGVHQGRGVPYGLAGNRATLRCGQCGNTWSVTIPPDKRCPACFLPHGGIGLVQNNLPTSEGTQRNYRCDRPECGQRWQARVRVVIDRIEHREVE